MKSGTPSPFESETVKTIGFDRISSSLISIPLLEVTLVGVLIYPSGAFVSSIVIFPKGMVAFPSAVRKRGSLPSTR